MDGQGKVVGGSGKNSYVPRLVADPTQRQPKGVLENRFATGLPGAKRAILTFENWSKQKLKPS